MSLTPFRALLGGVLAAAVIWFGWQWWQQRPNNNLDLPPAELPFGESQTNTDQIAELSPEQWQVSSHPLSIERQRNRTYDGSELVIVEELGTPRNYDQFLASYQSEGLTIYGLLTVPTGDPPPTGWPIIIFNHGYIPPEQYRTTQRYEAYQAYFARNGYITFKSDYRGHGDSDGDPVGGYFSPDYTTDVLNAKSSVQKFAEADPNRVGFWGHSMGGFLTLRSMVIADDIDAGVIWGDVVGSYQEIYEAWQKRRQRWSPSPEESHARREASTSSRAIYEE